MMKALVGFAAALSAVAAPLAAEEFPPKSETLKQITMGTVGDVVVRGVDPRASTTTITSTSTSTFPRSGLGFSNSKSETFDSTPGRPGQVLRIINSSIYDLKDISIECFYVAESGTPVGSTKSQTFLLIFPASSRRDVLFRD